MNQVISGFPGIGKTFFQNTTSLNVSDSDSSKFSWSSLGIRNTKFPQNYINHIKNLLLEKEIILISSHNMVRKCLKENKIFFTLVYPDISLKQEYLKRFINRKSSSSFINMINNNWELFIKEIEQEKNCDLVKLLSGQFLSNVI